MRDKERFALFCLRPDGQRIEEGWINLHLLLWKQIIYALVQVTTEDQPFKPHSIWGAAWTRFQKKALAKHESIRTVALRDQSREMNRKTSRRWARRWRLSRQQMAKETLYGTHP